MKADTTRSTFKQTKHYNGVLMQQGRVQLDTDWNEQIDITGHRFETETVDVIGKCGAPMHDAGFHIVANANDLTAEEKKLPENQNPPALGANDLLISGGRYYVDGILCENDSIVAYTKQPDLPNAAVVNQAGTYLAYLDVWSRHITALEDASIREVALGGPDTATRSRTIWQVKLFRVGDANLAANCSTVFNNWNDEIAAGTGKLAARAATSAPSNDPCIVAPGAGYRRLENQHYRVEVHDKGPLGTATFKWSRDNGSIVTKWESQSVNDLTVSSTGRDKVLSFAAGNWVELSDDTNDLLGTPGTLVQLAKVEGSVLTINPASAIPAGPINIANFPKNPKVRRWDMAALLKPNNQNWIDLEDGVQVHFTNGTFKTGDYWLIPARTATADVEWPIDTTTNQPATQLPFGIKHHYCRLAVAKNDGTKWISPTDCRHIFPPLTELINFFYVGGDGQEVMPDLTQPNVLTALPLPLEAGVTNGEWPVAGASVRFTITKGNGRLQGNVTTVTAATGTNGIASCGWNLDATNQTQQVEAVLLDEGGNPICVPIHYLANLSVASQVAYDPGQTCASLQNKKTVQQAIDTLATLASLYPVSGDDQSILPAETLQPVVVVAASKCGPAAGMKVVFTVISGGGQVNAGGPAGPTVTITTDAQGQAACNWTLGAPLGTQVVEAVLQAGPNQIVPPVSVRFTAQVRSEAGSDPGFHVTGLTLLSTGGPLKNDMDLQPVQLEKGLRVECDAEIDPSALAQKHPRENPVCCVAVDIPYPFTQTDRDFFNTQPACFQTIILGAHADVAGKNVVWSPTGGTVGWINALFTKLNLAQLPLRVLARLQLRGNFIWSKKDSEIFLDGELFVRKSQSDLIFKSGDRIRGGNVDMWFWLVPPPPAQPAVVLEANGGILFVSGSVKDGTGAAIPSVLVTLHANTLPDKTALTNSTGQFTFNNLPPGAYEVSVTVSGSTVKKSVNVIGPP